MGALPVYALTRRPTLTGAMKRLCWALLTSVCHVDVPDFACLNSSIQYPVPDVDYIYYNAFRHRFLGGRPLPIPTYGHRECKNR